MVKAIEPNDLIKAFLKGINVEDPLEYIRAICSATTGNYPIYFLLQQANASINDAIKMVDDTTAVSYTHLDVYKRQASISFNGCLARASASILHSGIFLLQWCSSMPAAFVCRGVTGNTLADLKQMFSNSNMEFDESQSFMGGSTWISCDCARVPAPDRGLNPVL